MFYFARIGIVLYFKCGVVVGGTHFAHFLFIYSSCFVIIDVILLDITTIVGLGLR